jgi:3-deoxy-manno-octulosonate cytidylyltransferase (CMP-KDO synthetase)
MKIIGVIPARFASSRFPGKPLADIHGKPMIWWVYEQARKTKELDELVIATDNENIQEACKKNNIPVIMTSEDHPTGTDRVAEVAEKINGDLYINIQGDEPLINPDAISLLIGAFNDESVYFASLRNCILNSDEIKSVNTVKVVTDKDDYALYFSRGVIPSNLKGYTAKIYRHVGIYAYKRDFLLKFVKFPQSMLELGEAVEPLRAMENGYKIKVLETNYVSIGVDTPADLELVKKLLLKS